jgi:hypothetical protein
MQTKRGDISRERTDSYPAVVANEKRLMIEGMAPIELLMFWAIGGSVPRQRSAMLGEMLAEWQAGNRFGLSEAWVATVDAMVVAQATWNKQKTSAA